MIIIASGFRSLQRHETVPDRRVSGHVHVHVVVGPVVGRVAAAAAVVVEVVVRPGVAVPARRPGLRALPGPRPLSGLVPRRVRPAAARVADVRHPLGNGKRLPRLSELCARKQTALIIW